MKKMRLSFSLLNVWSQGRTDIAVSLYFHMKGLKTPQIEAGKEKHQEISKCIKETGQLPKWFSTIKLSNPKPDHVVVVDYNEMFTLKSIYDCLDEPNVLHEYKTGVSDSLEYAGEFQIPFYFLTAEIAGIPLDRAYLIHHNQYKKQTDYALVWNSKFMVQKAMNLIDSVGPEIYQFFNEQGLI